MSTSKTHYALISVGTESDTQQWEYAECGQKEFVNYTTNWNSVTCKKCLNSRIRTVKKWASTEPIRAATLEETD